MRAGRRGELKPFPAYGADAAPSYSRYARLASTEHWRLQHMAEACELGRSRVTHYGKQLTNTTPVEYLAHCRVRAAQRLLEGACARLEHQPRVFSARRRSRRPSPRHPKPGPP